MGGCEEWGVDWRTVNLPDLARFKHSVEATPVAPGRVRRGATVNASLTAVCEFLRFCSRTVRVREVRARVETPFLEARTVEQAAAVLGCCRRRREVFMVRLMLDSGLRIGEVLGLRREDMHLLGDSRSLGCVVVGPHVHVRRRANPNGALAKSRFPRTVPASKAVAVAYSDYRFERGEVLGADDANMVLVNLYHGPLGAPMTYRAAKGFFERLARPCGFAVRPHMLRHMAATYWVRAVSTST